MKTLVLAKLAQDDTIECDVSPYTHHINGDCGGTKFCPYCKVTLNVLPIGTGPTSVEAVYVGGGI